MRMTRNTFTRKRDSITAYTDFKNQAFTYTFTSIAFPPFTTAPALVSSSRKPFFSSTRADARFSGNTSPMMRYSANSRKAIPQICLTASVPIPWDQNGVRII